MSVAPWKQPEEVPIYMLKDGQRFRLNFLDVGSDRVVTGTLISVNKCSAHVALDGTGVRSFTAHGEDGEEREVTMPGRAHETYWAPNALVEPVDEFVPLEQFADKGGQTMAKIKKTPKEKKAKEPKQLLTTRYEVTAKSAVNAGYADPEKKTQAALIYRFVRDAKTPPTFAEILAGIDKRSLKTESKKLENNFRWYINDLRKKGFVKSVEEREPAAA
jgi:hypothetical protein